MWGIHTSPYAEEPSSDFVAVTGWMELSTACMYLLKAMLALTALLLLVEKLPHALLTQL